MDTARGRTALLWLRRLVVVAGLLLGGWLIGAAPANADTGLADLANELIDRASAGEDIGGLIDSAIGGETEPETAEPAPAPAPEPQQTSSASGSASSTPGVEQENTTTFGGIDYGPVPGTSWGWADNRVTTTAVAVKVTAPVRAPPPKKAPAPAKKPAVAASAPVQQVSAPAAPQVRDDRADRGPSTAPAERPQERPAPPVPAPGSGSSAGSAHDAGNQYRGGAPGVLATREHAGAPSGGWPIAFPQVHGAAVEAAGTPTSRPD